MVKNLLEINVVDIRKREIERAREKATTLYSLMSSRYTYIEKLLV